MTDGAGQLRRRWVAYRAEAVAPRITLFRLLPVAGRGLLAGYLALAVVLGLLPVGFVISTSVLIGQVPAAVDDGLGSAAWQHLIVVFLWASTFFFLQQFLTPLQSSLGALTKHRVDGRIHDRLIDVALRSTGIASLEDQANLDSLREATESLERAFRTPGDACAAVLALVVRYVRLAGFTVLIGVEVSWLPAAMLFLVAMLFRYGHRSALRIRAQLLPKLMATRRRSAYFRELGLGAATAKELRIFGLTPWLIERYRDSMLAYLLPMFRERRRLNVTRFLWLTALGLVVTGPALVWMVRSAAAGRLTLTELVLGLQAAIAVILLGEFYHEADDATQFGMIAVQALGDFERRIDASAAADVRSTAPAASTVSTEQAGARTTTAGLPERDIRFAGVSFSYPGSDRPVLDGLELTLRAGECTALVGLNGAGKTTLVKLLARLHEPTAGELLVDGRDVRELPVVAWRRQLGVIFQDFTRYEITAADNIAFGAVERPADPDAVRAAARQAGVLDVLERLPDGLQTVLTRTLEGGAELSGGQWQRVAIARALYAVGAGAKLLVLDEPTAALDVRAEAEFFADFTERTRGVTTLLISHRFSSVRHADRIVVLEHGRLIEDGTHESLLQQGGRYAGLFQMQAERFAADSAGATGSAGTGPGSVGTEDQAAGHPR